MPTNPTYPIIKTYRGGFYNSKKDQYGKDDRVYSAKDMRKPYDVIYTDGVKPDPDGTAGENLKVVKNSKMGIKIKKGFAKLGGAWFENPSDYSITLADATSNTRYDCVIIRNDDSDDKREPEIKIVSLDHIPTENDLVRNDTIYEICIAYVKVEPNIYSIDDNNIIDTRDISPLSSVMTGVGATVIKTYSSTFYSEYKNQTDIPIQISQYNKDRDSLQVIVEGQTFIKDLNYTILSNEKIRLHLGLPVEGTKIYFNVIKNVNAAGVDSMVTQVNEMEQDIIDLNKTKTFYYFCEGENDNVFLTHLIEELFYEYNAIEIKVCGKKFGVSDFFAIDAGDSTSFYNCIKLDNGADNNKRIVLDFANCENIIMDLENADESFALFYGHNCRIKNGKFSIYGVCRSFELFNNAKLIDCENCSFFVDATGEIKGLVSASESAKYRNCRVEVLSAEQNAYASYLKANQILDLTDCTLYGYRGTGTSKDSAGIYTEVSTSTSTTVLRATNCNMPKTDRASYAQNAPFKINAYTNYSLVGNLVFQAGTKTSTAKGTEYNTMVVNRPN